MENPVSMNGLKNAVWVMAAVLLAVTIYNIYQAMKSPEKTVSVPLPAN
jgi:hypothetical protein